MRSAAACARNYGEIAYDYLVIATGATHSYFGHDDWADVAPGLKRIEDATRIRRSILIAFERAEATVGYRAEQGRLLTFVIVGGGATGVEMAGAIAEIARQTLAADFRRIDPRAARIVLHRGRAAPAADLSARSVGLRARDARECGRRCQNGHDGHQLRQRRRRYQRRPDRRRHDHLGRRRRRLAGRALARRRGRSRRTREGRARPIAAGASGDLRHRRHRGGNRRRTAGRCPASRPPPSRWANMSAS